MTLEQLSTVNIYAQDSSVVPAANHGATAYTDCIGKLSEGVDFALVGYLDASRRILRLLLAGGPPAIARLVVSVAIYAIQGCPRRAWSHIIQEGFKAFCPAFAHSNAPSAPESVLQESRIRASSFHRTPSVMLRRRFPCSVAMHRLRSGKPLAPHTATSLSRSASKVGTGNYGAASTVAVTIPNNLRPTRRRLRNNGQPAVLMPYKIHFFHAPTIAQREAL